MYSPGAKVDLTKMIFFSDSDRVGGNEVIGWSPSFIESFIEPWHHEDVIGWLVPTPREEVGW